MGTEGGIVETGLGRRKTEEEAHSDIKGRTGVPAGKQPDRKESHSRKEVPLHLKSSDTQKCY